MKSTDGVIVFAIVSLFKLNKLLIIEYVLIYLNYVHCTETFY